MLTQIVHLFLFACNATVQEKLIKTEDDFVWTVDTAPVGRFIIDVEFLDLKICTMKVSSFIFFYTILMVVGLVHTRGTTKAK